MSQIVCGDFGHIIYSFFLGPHEKNELKRLFTDSAEHCSPHGLSEASKREEEKVQ